MPPLADLEPGFGNLAVFDFVDANDIHLALSFRKSLRDRFMVYDDIADHNACQQGSVQVGFLEALDCRSRVSAAFPARSVEGNA